MIPVSSQVQEHLLVVGSYTESYGPFRAEGEGISLVRLSSSGQLELLDCLALPNPSYLRPNGASQLYATMETNDTRAGVALIGLDRKAMRLEHRSQTASPGTIPCHLDLHPNGQWIAGACYGSGEVYLRALADDGTLLKDSGSTVQHLGRSVNPQRQTTAHPHASRFSPDGNWLIVPDLGMDQVVSYPFDPDTGALGQQPRRWIAPPGSGPRLPLFSRDGRHLVLVKEMASEVSSFEWNDGILQEVCSISALLDGFSGPNTTAGLRWDATGTSFAVSNRGSNSLSLYHFDNSDGRVTPWCSIPSGGEKPRDFEFSPCGRWLITSNQNGDSLVVYALGGDRPVDTGHRLPVRSPSCVRVLPPDSR